MLEVRGICKSYGGRQVLSPVSFQMEAGEGLGVAGPNGSGKSTLLTLLAQVRSPDGGEILFQGRSILGKRKFLRRRLGYVPQTNQLFAELTVGQQLRLWQAACGLDGPLPEEPVERMGLGPLLSRPIRQLSDGTCRRVSIAMAQLTRPEILVMDEATSGLDQTYVRELLDWIEAFTRRGGYLVWCTHRPSELEKLCSRCLCLEEGRAWWQPVSHEKE